MDCSYEVRSSNTIGRYLVASRDLKARELVLSEEPLITGPTDEPDNITTCLGCCLKMTENPYSRCSRCHFPVCSSSCEQKIEHAENECLVFTRNRVDYPPPYSSHVMNKSIIILRCLLLKEKDSIKWDQLMTQSDSRESRRNRPNCITADERILENFRKYLPGEGSFDEEEILTLSGIVDVNAHAFPVKVDGKVVSLKCHIYNKITLLAHSCNPNSSWGTVSSSSSLSTTTSTLEIKTNIPIAQGKIISVAYDDRNLLYGTLRRLIPMEISGMFICKCSRCLDPTELGTYLSALKCQQCPEGQGYLLSLNPTDSFADWKCDSCGNEINEIDISEIIDEAESVAGFPKKDLLIEPDGDVDVLKDYINTFSGTILHPNHYILQEVNLRIIRTECYDVCELHEAELTEFGQRCKRLLDILDILIPGFGEYRAFIQYHYFKALLSLQERKEEVQSGLDSSNHVKDHGPNPEESLKTYKRILKMQQEVLTFLDEKFTSHNKRIDFVKDKIDIVKDKIKSMENGDS